VIEEESRVDVLLRTWDDEAQFSKEQINVFYISIEERSMTG
jgi:hypothetical protein